MSCSIELINAGQRVAQFTVSQHKHITRSLAIATSDQAIKVYWREALWRECGRSVNRKRATMHVVKIWGTPGLDGGVSGTQMLL